MQGNEGIGEEKNIYHLSFLISHWKRRNQVAKERRARQEDDGQKSFATWSE